MPGISAPRYLRHFLNQINARCSRAAAADSHLLLDWCEEGLDHYPFSNILERVVPPGEISRDLLPRFAFSRWVAGILDLKLSVLYSRWSGLQFYRKVCWEVWCLTGRCVGWFQT
jgi:hypothetical protein